MIARLRDLGIELVSVYLQEKILDEYRTADNGFGLRISQITLPVKLFGKTLFKSRP